MDFKSTHNLLFESAKYDQPINDGYDWQRFRIGTCEGLWCDGGSSYNILAIENNEPNNGHLTDVLEWFENSAKRDKKDFKIMEFSYTNPKFKKHLLKKKGFVCCDLDNVIKRFRQ